MAVSIVASGTVTVSNSSSSAVIEIILPDLSFANSAAQVEAGNRTGLLTNVLSYNQTILVPINTPESIVIEAGTVAGWRDNNPSTVPANAYAFIDPQISIDPSVIDPSDYSIEFSANLPPNPAVPSNPGAVPEPSTYGLLAGAALLGMAGFRRRRLSTIRAN